MEIRVCPECARAFYMSKDSEYIVCPHCGTVISDRRARRREKKALSFSFKLKGATRKATLTDYSGEGARIRYRGDALRKGALLQIEIKELKIHRKGTSVWTKTLKSSLKESGLKLE